MCINTDGNKLVIFSGIALYCGDNYMLMLMYRLVWLVFEASIPTCACFHEGKLLDYVGSIFNLCHMMQLTKY